MGQSESVNGRQMAAAVNTIANDGVRVDLSLVRGNATTDAGEQVGTDQATTTEVISAEAARKTALMMERVVDPEAGVAPGAQIPGYRVAGKTGTAQRVGEECRYDGTFTVSLPGFALADDPRFTVYVVVQNPRNGGGGGLGRRPRVRQDRRLRAAPLRRPAHRHPRLRPARRVVTWLHISRRPGPYLALTRRRSRADPARIARC